MKRILIICCIAGLFSACSDFLKEYSQDLAKVESFSDLDEVFLGKGYLPWGRSEAGDYGMSTVVDAYFQATHHMADEMAFISENGGLAVQNEKVLYQDSFPPALVKELVEAIYDRKGAEFTCSTKDFYYIRPKTAHYRDLMLNVVKNNCRDIESFDEIKEPCMKVAVYERGGIQEESIRYWRERFGDKCTVVTSGFAWVDFVPFETNKARGLKEYQKRFGIKPEECVVFGDEYNDIAMLESVPYSFAMAHAKPGVKRAAAYQTERVELILEKLIRAGGNMEEVLRECIQKKA